MVVWQDHSSLRFTKLPSRRSNIDIAFVKKNHGDGEPFDGQGGILAHAFFPQYGGDIHFDDDEPWSPGLNKGLDLYAVAAHEIGHALGLKHSRNNQALMAPFYQSYSNDGIRLHQDDIDALQHLYGSPDEEEDLSSELQSNTVSELPVEQGDENHPDLLRQAVDICANAALDAITTIGNGSTYAFQGQWYWRLNQLSFDQGYPRKIANDWDGLPDNLQAAVTNNSGVTYFFKADQFWLYDPDGRRLSGYPKKIVDNLYDLPNDIDAAMTWSYNRRMYLFKGRFFWQYASNNARSIWPQPIKFISPKLNRIDAAFTWTNGKSYIFVGDSYYRINNWRILKAAPGYPRSTAEWWFGCSPVGLAEQGKRTRRATFLQDR